MREELPSIVVMMATEEDAPELARLLEVFEDQSLSITQVKHRQARTQGIETAFISKLGETVVGLACLRLVPCLSSENPQAEVTELFVQKDYQDSDVSQALLEKVEAQATQGGAEELILMTGLRNTGAQNLYRALGYRDYALAMRKHLR